MSETASKIWRKAAGVRRNPDCARCQFMQRTDPYAVCPNHHDINKMDQRCQVCKAPPGEPHDMSVIRKLAEDPHAPGCVRRSKHPAPDECDWGCDHRAERRP